MSNGVDFKKISLENRELLNSALAREAALREELEKVCGDEWRKDKRQIVDLQQRLTVAEQLLQETSKAILRHQAEQPMSKRLSGLLTKARASVDRHLKGAALKPAADVIINEGR